MGRVLESFHRSKGLVRYHLIFSTKYRRKCLLGLENLVYESIDRCVAASDFIVLSCGVEDGYHVHLVVGVAPSLGVGAIVCRLKQFTTHDLWLRAGGVLRRFYWRGNHVLWTHGYYCSTLGYVTEEKAIEYAEKQRQHDTN